MSTTASRTVVQRLSRQFLVPVAIIRDDRGEGDDSRDAQQFAASRDFDPAVTVAEKTAVTDAHEAVRQHVEELLELGEAQNDGEFPREARIRDVLDHSIFAQGHAIEQSQGTDADVERGPGKLLGEQVLLIGTDVFRPE